MTDFPDKVDKLIKSEGAAWEKASVCTSWILVTEWVDSEGVVWLEEHRTSDMPIWRRLGILSHILSEPAIEPEDYEEYD